MKPFGYAAFATLTFLAASRQVLAQPAPVPTPTPRGTAPGAAVAAPTSSEPELTLEDALLIAFANQGSVGAAQQSFVGAQQRVKSAQSALYPQANVTVNSNVASSTSVSQSTTTTGGTGGTGGGGTGTGTGTTFSTSSTYSVTTQTNLGLTQTIYDAGRNRAQIRQSQASALSSQAEIGVTRQNLAYQVASGFYDQLRQERLVVQRRQQVGLAEQQLAQIEAQIEAGTAARVDAQSVRVTLSQARFDLVTAQNNLKTAQTNLRNALGLTRGPSLRLRENPDVATLSTTIAPTSSLLTLPLTGNAPAAGADTTGGTVPAPEAAPPVAAPPAAVTPPVAAAAEATTPVDTSAADTTVAQVAPEPTLAPIVLPKLASLTEYLEEARRQRPDLIQSRAAVQSSEASVAIARADRLPQVAGTAGYNLQNIYNSGRGLTAGLSLSLPLFDAGGRRADVKAAQADLEANRIKLTQLDKDIAADVEATYVNVSGAVESIENARALVESARDNLEAATEKYRLGVGIILDVVNAQTQFAQAQTSATGAIYDYQIALADLSRAVGRFATDTGTRTPLAAGQPSSQPVSQPASNTAAPAPPTTSTTPAAR